MTKERLAIAAGELYRRGLSRGEVRLCLDFYDLPSNEVLAERMGTSVMAVKLKLWSICAKLMPGQRGVRTVLYGNLEAIVRKIEKDGGVQCPGGLTLYKGKENGKA